VRRAGDVLAREQHNATFPLPLQENVLDMQLVESSLENQIGPEKSTSRKLAVRCRELSKSEEDSRTPNYVIIYGAKTE
jgi:hypothetical protein